MVLVVVTVVDSEKVGVHGGIALAIEHSDRAAVCLLLHICGAKYLRPQPIILFCVYAVI